MSFPNTNDQLIKFLLDFLVAGRSVGGDGEEHGEDGGVGTSSGRFRIFVSTFDGSSSTLVTSPSVSSSELESELDNLGFRLTARLILLNLKAFKNLNKSWF